MKRKTIVYLIILIAGIVNVILSQTFNSSIALLVFAVYIPFHVISLIFYRESKIITAYHIFQIINLFGFFALSQFQGAFFRVFGIMSFFGAIVTVLLAFGAVLQHKTYKLNERSFMWFSVFGFIFFSIYQPYILNLLSAFFGNLTIEIRQTQTVFFLVRTILLGINVVLQLLCVKNNEINIYLDQQEQKIKDSYKVTDMPFFDKS
jgi:hypothetical protein